MFKRLLIGQGCMLQGRLASVASPQQGLPPLYAGGLEQVLVLFWGIKCLLEEYATKIIRIF